MSNKIRIFDTLTDVYYGIKNDPHIIQCHQGGTSSSKTVSILQFLLTELSTKPGKHCTIVGQDFPNLYSGAMRDFKNLVMGSEYLKTIAIENPTGDRGPYRFRNGSIIEFKSYDTWQDAKSGKRDYLFINEAQGVKYEIAKELINRTRDRIFIDYNPNAKFWVHYRLLLEEESVSLNISNFTHNPYCPERIKTMLLRAKVTAEQPDATQAQKNFWRVYGLGLTGVVEGVVFDNVNYCTFLPPNLTKVGYGLDFGFQNDPTALVKMGVKSQKVYGKELIYETKLHILDLIKKFKSLGISKNIPIIADGQNKESILLIKKAGYNIKPSAKGKGSVQLGIDALQSLDLWLTNDSINWKVEQENFKYKQKDGLWLNETVTTHNHCWDAARYYVEEVLGFRKLRQGKRGGARKVRTF